MYYGEFKCREDIISNFYISSFEGTVVHAHYDCEDYEGSAVVIFVHNGMFHYVSGSHCSCFGLEDQWSPEEMTAQTLVHMIRKGSIRGIGGNSRLGDAIERLDDLIDKDSSEEQIMCWLRLLL